MSSINLNEFMHPNNIYRVRPNFAQLAQEFPSFRPFVKLYSGKSVIDYNDRNALRALTQTLLKKDFDLDVNIPENRLIPTVTQRLNYVLWVQDLMNKLRETNIVSESEAINGIDIGTGCCAIYPLIAASIHQNWHFVATDIDQFNLEMATTNVNNNHLSHRIKVIEAKQSMFNAALEVFATTQQPIHFCMCNPPFFNDNDDCEVDINSNKILNDLNKLYKRSKSNNSVAIESSVDGGEVAFVKKIIYESIILKNKIAIYTVMLGKKTSFLEIKKLIKSHTEFNVFKSFVCTEFCQGKTKRWGIAWTALDGLNLKQVPAIKASLQKPLIYYLPPIIKDTKYELHSICDKIKKLLEEELQLDSIRKVRETTKCIEFELKTNRNTWSNQRRIRRRQTKTIESNNTDNCMNLSTNSSNPESNGLENDINKDCNSVTDEDITDINSSNQESNVLKNSINKDSFSATDEDITDIPFTELSDETTKRKIDESSDEELAINSCADLINKKCKNQIDKMIYRPFETNLLHCSLIIKRDKKAYFIKMQTQPLSVAYHSTCQLFQYFKNKLN